MDNLSDLLRKAGFNEPPELKQIKDYIAKEYKQAAKVSLMNDNLVVSVPSAAFANTLRFNNTKMVNELNITKKVIYRIA